jgi:hypothetical protein
MKGHNGAETEKADKSLRMVNPEPCEMVERHGHAYNDPRLTQNPWA